MDTNKLYWVGIRESEIIDTNHIFSGSITIFGTGKGSNYAYEKEYKERFDYNQDNDSWISFVNQKAAIIIDNNPSAVFLLYYFPELGIYDKKLQQHLTALNDPDLITLLDNKLNTREWLKDSVTLPPYAVYKGKNISYEQLHSMFPDVTDYVIQAEYSCGGSGTWLFNSFNEIEVLKKLEVNSSYTITPYFKYNISLNIHLIIYEKEIILMPPSVQIVSQKTGAFLYKGADFLMYQKLPELLRRQLDDASLAIGKRLQHIGYLGVCGIDFIATNQDLYFMEINPRFQSSTFLINKAYSQTGNPLSIQELHIDAFKNAKCSYEIPGINIDYSFYSYSKQEHCNLQLRKLWELQTSLPDEVECIDDDLNWNYKLENDTYLYKAVFNYNITALSPDCCCRIAPNIDIENTQLQIPTDDMIQLKLMLLNHGIRLTAPVKEQLVLCGGPNYEEFYALDITLRNHIHISVPYMTRISALSPFQVKLDERGRFILYFWDDLLEEISIRLNDDLGEQCTQNGWKYNQIAYLGIDRLRVYHRTGCYFKSNDVGCRFCDIEKSSKLLNQEDIMEVIDAYHNHSAIKHYMIGGGSNCPSSNFNSILELARYIKEMEHKPIYLMSLPPQDISLLSRLKEAGITEVSFNLEVFDRTFAKEYMPGKASISLDVYEKAFKESVKLWGKTGNVRSIFIVGLEPLQSLLKGIEFVCRLGVSPILSLFKPIEETPLSHLLPPSDEEILKLYHLTKKLCDSYGIEMGPSCPQCEDNTFKLTL